MNGSPSPPSSRKPDEHSPQGSSPPATAPDPPQFLSASVLQDPTLRTPGSEIPEALFALSDAEPFNISPVLNAPADPTTPQVNRTLILGLALFLIAIILSTAVYLYRDTHPPASSVAPHSLLHRATHTTSG